VFDDHGRHHDQFGLPAKTEMRRLVMIGLPEAQVDVDVNVRKQISQMSLDELRQLEERLVASFTPPLLPSVPG
jgi:hypothetical protein